MPLIRDLIIAGIGGIFVFFLREGIRYYRRPRLCIDLYEAQGKRPHLPEKELKATCIDSAGHHVVRRERTRDLHLVVANQGLRSARGCEATMDILKDDEEIPKPIRLGWRKRPPVLYRELSDPEAMRQRTAPFDINRRDSALLDVLRLRYYKYEDEETSEIMKKEVNKLTTLSSFRNHDFEPNTDYRLEITVTGSNVNPCSISLNLRWNGGFEDEDIRSAIRVSNN